MTTLSARKRLLVPILVLTVGALVATACKPKPAPAPPVGSLTVQGSASVSVGQITSWFNGRTPHPSGVYAASVPVATLAQYFVEEGAAEGIRGDVAFVQSVLETGWFRFPGSVPAAYNNFAGIGATGPGGVPAQFPDARTGVRAQIQHLKAYADPAATTCTVPPLHNPCVDPRFALVSPKGKASTWNQMGNGNWATSTTYAQKILALFSELLTYNGATAS